MTSDDVTKQIIDHNFPCCCCSQQNVDCKLQFQGMKKIYLSSLIEFIHIHMEYNIDTYGVCGRWVRELDADEQLSVWTMLLAGLGWAGLGWLG